MQRNDQKITCPNCQNVMKEVSLSEHYGNRQIVIEQCPQCGGLWFDASEFYRVKIGEAVELEKLNPNKLSESTVLATGSLICPKDGQVLQRYQDPYFSDTGFLKEFKLFSCSQCGGFWFNRGHFTAYQARRAQTGMKQNNTGSLATDLLQLEEYKKDLEQRKLLGSFIRSSGGMGLSIGGKSSGDWRLDILYDIIGMVLRRIFN